MACGCTTACGCDVQAGAGILVQRIGDTFIVSSTSLILTSVLDSDCVSMSLVDGVLSASLILDNPGGVAIELTCGAAGLAAALLFDNASGNGGVALALDGLNNLYADLVLDPASPTELSVSASGLSVGAPRFVTIAKWGTD